jgi:ABC-type antimicrobial peptide transport system permease subunit
MAVLLGAIGIHGLLAFAVSTRTAEIGVRMALGARRMDIVELVVARSLMLATAGIASGVVLAYWSGRAALSLLAGVEPGDAATFAVAVAVTVAMTIAGSARPALPAARVDPVTVMRIE